MDARGSRRSGNRSDNRCHHFQWWFRVRIGSARVPGHIDSAPLKVVAPMKGCRSRVVPRSRCALVDDPQSLLGVHWSGESNPAAGKESTLHLPKVDLDIDTDNTNGFSAPDSNAAEDEAEMQGPGKLMFTGLADTDSDGIPDWADGIELAGREAGPSGAAFVPLVLDVPDEVIAALDDPSAYVALAYDMSDPALITPGNLSVRPPGAFRLWTKDGTSMRNPLPATEGGDPVPPPGYVALLAWYTGGCTDPGLASMLFQGTPANPGPYIEPTCVADLCTGSDAQLALEAARYPSGHRQVRWYPIVGIATQSAGDAPVQGALWELLFSFLPMVPNDPTEISPLSPANSDLIVPAASQRNLRLTGSPNELAGQEFQFTAHVAVPGLSGETSSVEISTKVRSLLSGWPTVFNTSWSLGP
jgi:hypothetical protein